MAADPTNPIVDRELRWQAAWKARHLGRAVAQPGRSKFYILFAYPGPSGFQHVGHMRGFTYADMIARYHRMRGEAIFFPGGTHASGLPAITFAAKVARRDPDTVEELHARGLNDADIASLEVPEKAARYLGNEYWDLWERLGLLMDRSTHVTTIDLDYQRFISWQFSTLQRLGKLVQKPYYASYCPVDGPVSVDPSETDLSSGGTAEMVTYTLVPFPLEDGRVLLAATLRPETVYGVTNVWLPPTGHLVEWQHSGQRYLLAPAGAARLCEQAGGTVGPAVDVAALHGKTVTVPLTRESVPILPSSLVEPSVGTGVVMSVPAHAPADWVALQELPESERAPLLPTVRSIIEVPEESLNPADRQSMAGTGFPAQKVAAALKVSGLKDHAALDEATGHLYRLELRSGRMSTGEFRGESVATVREKVARRFFPEGGLEIREFSQKVICRCGREVIIRRVPDQWFLAYGSPEWKSQMLEASKRMHFYPPEYGEELSGIAGWFEDRPAVRRGKWLGTPFPADPSWVIEPIADSTFYPAYYVVRRLVAEGDLTVDDLTPEFFDYVYLGQGAPPTSERKESWERARREFLYWYPVDINLGGKEHKRVHFPVFLYMHTALLPPPLQPRGIFINWWITSYTGEKLSKKDQKGGAVPPVDVALSRYGADGLRLYYALGASPFQDVKWEEDQCQNAHARVEETLELVLQTARGAASSDDPLSLTEHVDRWFSAQLSEVIHGVRDAWDGYDLRSAAQATYVTLPALFRRYRARGGNHLPLLRRAGEAWCRMLVPITPHAAEEASSAFGERGSLASERTFPTGEDFPRHPTAIAFERTLEQAEEDIAALLKVWNAPPRQLTLFVASPWKYRAAELVPASIRQGRLDVKSFIEKARADPLLQAHLPDLARFAGEFKRAEEASAVAGLTPGEEHALFSGARDYLSRRFRIPEILVLTEDDADAGKDPKGRRHRAHPGKPAMLLE